ncbi:hypothetical protein CSOJ01_15347 [Colletotrichum sojae]|uniref:Uncharacterized protein n=1 Tax=Colletotrichum sojae TaxID=2175907 RepID=A0A8H6IN97_9PEZI|nr:hypothetical protein CSOJ01_15347 [Colletotrichum sojae]
MKRSGRYPKRPRLLAPSTKEISYAPVTYKAVEDGGAATIHCLGLALKLFERLIAAGGLGFRNQEDLPSTSRDFTKVKRTAMSRVSPTNTIIAPCVSPTNYLQAQAPSTRDFNGAQGNEAQNPFTDAQATSENARTKPKPQPKPKAAQKKTRTQNRDDSLSSVDVDQSSSLEHEHQLDQRLAQYLDPSRAAACSKAVASPDGSTKGNLSE